jgi:hypothetical protein
VATGIVAADNGALVRVADDGSRRVLAATEGVPFDVTADAAGGVVYLERWTHRPDHVPPWTASSCPARSLVTFSRDNTTAFVHRLVRRAGREQAKF